MLNVLSAVQENKAEIKTVWNMFKEDPLSPATSYWKNFGMPGIGLFLEGYVVSIASTVLYKLQQQWRIQAILRLYYLCADTYTNISNFRWHIASQLVLCCCLQIFSISNNSTLFKQAYPRCWSKFTDCNEVRLAHTHCSPYQQILFRHVHIQELAFLSRPLTACHANTLACQVFAIALQ